MDVEMIPVTEIIPYNKNPRKNEKAVEVVMKSIKEFGFKVPIIIDKDNIIVAGHTRLEAAIKLEMKEVPIIWADDLTDKQIKAFRIMENKSQEFSYWDYDLLKQELLEIKSMNIDLSSTGFGEDEIQFFNPDSDKPVNDSYAEWRKSGGLEFGNKDQTGFKTILLHFKSAEDVQKFSTLINQTISERTKYLWFPKQPDDKVKGIKYEEI